MPPPSHIAIESFEVIDKILSTTTICCCQGGSIPFPEFGQHFQFAPGISASKLIV